MCIRNRFFLVALVHVYNLLSALNEQQTNFFMFFTHEFKIWKLWKLWVLGGALPPCSPLYTPLQLPNLSIPTFPLIAHLTTSSLLPSPTYFCLNSSHSSLFSLSFFINSFCYFSPFSLFSVSIAFLFLFIFPYPPILYFFSSLFFHMFSLF